ncbi:hypothetical protein Daesc_002661 [Daldinia eschscholtzii]|uniref:Uncharacterized protein n=1 Tax=Daldinia eschscholtzii TaxID=292717 RepID=A0AAX6MS82_9PEZI
MPEKRPLPSEQEDRTSRKRVRTKAKWVTGASEKEKNKAINMALSKANVGKKYTWMDQNTGAIKKPEPPVKKTTAAKEYGVTKRPASPELPTPALASPPPTDESFVHPSNESAAGDVTEGFNEDVAEMEKALAEDEEFGDIVAAMEDELAKEIDPHETATVTEKQVTEDQTTKLELTNGSSEDPIVISSRDPSPVAIPSPEKTPAKTTKADEKRPALLTPPKADEKKKRPVRKPVQKKSKSAAQKPQEPEEDPAVAEAHEKADLFAMLNFIEQFVY